MDDRDSHWLPSRRDLHGLQPLRGKAPKESVRVGLSSTAAMVLVGLIVVLGTVGILRVVLPAGTASSSFYQAEHSEQANGPLSIIETDQSARGEESSLGRDGSASEAGNDSEPLIVFVTGAVKRSGVVSVPAGSRLEAAILEAGGLTEQADLVSVNLARLVEDGEHIHVLAEGEQQASASTAGGARDDDPLAQVGECVDLSSANQSQLETLDGVGPKIAQRIVQWRETNEGFAANEELLAVSGIGAKLYARILVGLCER
ncbi:ComEA family DNA-binding protein [Actinomycetaceae bacterium MB13-C1-2]|nr:ComEA family DNA-binding protein [Actinomycetaceae bacterium MB13-C1-2]